MDYEVIIIGGGHAACEAAAAAAKMTQRAAMVTMNPDAIARMSCNPAIGGLGKGQIVREIDALGGLMALATDATGIQFRTLNRSKGPAVQSPRAQADKAAYARWMTEKLTQLPGLDILAGTVCEILVKSGQAAGVVCADGRKITASAVVLTTGTFLAAKLYRGEEVWEGGRIGEGAAHQLADNLRFLGFDLYQMKTGTPPRVLRGSLDFDRMTVQPGDSPPVPFSCLTDRLEQEQLPCWLTYTNAETHAIIRAEMHRSPGRMLSKTAAPARYCPSIEDKIEKFPDKTRHQIFLEPEGCRSDWVYCNGLFTSLPGEVQDRLVRTIPGMERAEVCQYGYAVGYDMVPPEQLQSSLETRRIGGLFLAGQINGTSGYEEAAGQGLIAGINAVRFVHKRTPLILRRDQAYIAVMIDDLVTKGTDEPYRMFTSRAEYRLGLRADNADQRLTPIGRAIGLVDDCRWDRFSAKIAGLAAIRSRLKTLRLENRPAMEVLVRPTANYSPGDLLPNADPALLGQVLIEIKYAGYLAKERRQIEKFRTLESRRIPAWVDFSVIPGLRREAREKFASIRPHSLGQAARIPGITPADLAVLHIFLHGQ